MNKYQKKQRRIIFKIGKGLSEEFINAARKKGVTSSGLLRRWIKNFRFITLNSKYFTNEKTSQTFTLIADENLVHQIYVLLETTGLNTSQFLRYLIKQSCTSLAAKEISKSYNKIELEKLNETGNYYEIVNILNQSKSALDNKENYLLALSYERLGQSLKSEKILTNLIFQTSGLEQKNLYIKSSLIKIQLEILEGNQINSQIMLKHIEKEVFSLNNRGQIGKFYFLLAELYRLKDNILKTESYYDKALEYLDILNFKFEILEIYIRYASLYIYQSNFSNSHKYLKKIELLLIESNYNYYWGQFYNTKGIYNYLQNNIDDSQRSFKSSMNYNSKNNSVKEFTYNYENLARIALTSCSFQEANKYIAEIEKYEKVYKPYSSSKRSTVFKYYLESISHFKTAESKFLELLNQPNIFKPNLAKYLYYSSQYLNSNNDKDRKKGVSNLKKLSVEGHYPLVRNAALQTLQQKKLTPII